MAAASRNPGTGASPHPHLWALKKYIMQCKIPELLTSHQSGLPRVSGRYQTEITLWWLCFQNKVAAYTQASKLVQILPLGHYLDHCMHCLT